MSIFQRIKNVLRKEPPVRQTGDFEKDVRLGLMDSLLTSVKEQPEVICQAHKDALELDAHFYGHLAVWYQSRAKVRKLAETFVAGLATSPLELHREAAWVLLQDLAPNQVSNVLQLAKRQFGKAPRSLRQAVVHYLRERETRPERFDRAALRHAKSLKGLYASLHVKPGERAQAVLFEDRPPEHSLRWQLKQLARLESPAEQAVRIVEWRLPYPVVVGALREVTPAVLAALIEVMTPAEVMNHLKALEAKGALDHAEIRARIEHKLAAARTDRRVSDYKALVAAEAVQDEKLRRRLEDVTQVRLEAQGTITRSTAIFVDKSSSLEQAIDIGKRVAAMLAGLMKAPLHVVVFDTVAREVIAHGTGVADWERAFQGIVPNGATSIGAPLAWMRARKLVIEQILVVTDEEENTAPYFAEQYQLYAQELGVRPEVTILKVHGSSDHLERQLRNRTISYDVYQFTGDFYSLPNLVPLLTRPGRLELLMEILSTPLPTRGSIVPAPC